MTDKKLYIGMEMPPEGYPNIQTLRMKLITEVYLNRLKFNDLVRMYSRLLRIKRGYKYFRELLNEEVPDDLTQYTTDMLIEYVVYSAIKGTLEHMNGGPLNHEEHYEEYMKNILSLNERFEIHTILRFQEYIRKYRDSMHNILNHKAINKVLDKAIYEGRMTVDYSVPKKENKIEVNIETNKTGMFSNRSEI